MARVPYLTPEDLPESDRGLLDRPININRALANSPGALEANRFIGRWARFRSALDPRLRELAIVSIGVIAGNEYEYAHHLHFATEFGASDRDLADVRRYLRGESVSLEPAALAVLEATRMLTVRATLDDATWDALEAAVGRVAAVDAVFIASYYNMVVRVIAALDIDLEPEWAENLQTHPLVDDSDEAR